MIFEDIDYPRADAFVRGRFVFDDTATALRPGILVLPDAWGLTAFSIGKAEALARLGYVALAGGLHDGGHTAQDFEETGRLADALSADTARLRSVGRAGLAALASHPMVDAKRIGVIGFCLGGMAALELARDGFDGAAVASFHGLLKTKAPAQTGRVTPKILVCTGAQDPLVPPADVMAFQEEMTAADADYQIITYGRAGHSFAKKRAARKPGFGYHEFADQHSWSAMTTLLSAVFGAPL